MSELDVVCCSDDGYLPHVSTLLDSLAHSGTGSVRMHLLHCGLGPGLADLEAQATRLGIGLEPIEVPPERVGELAASSRFPAQIWLRMLAPELLPELGRALYLDADTIALGDLGPLCELDLEGNHVAAVTNVPYPEPSNRPYPDALGIEPRDYFNSGVLLLDLERIRADGIGAQLIAAARTHVDLDWPDQSVLNLVLGDSRLPLEPRWNATTAVLDLGLGDEVFAANELERARRAPLIRHFEGPGLNKPWHYLCRRSHRADYLRHRANTPWSEFVPEGRTPANRWVRVRGRARGLIGR